MKLKLAGIAGALVMIVSTQALSQTCASPIVLTSNDSVTGDLCTAGNPLASYGSTTSPQNEIIYSFVAQSASASISITETGGGDTFLGSIYLSPACNSSTDPTAFDFEGTPMTVDGSNSPDGATRYIYVTADPGGSNTACGTFQMDVAGTLPVKLQSFSVK